MSRRLACRFGAAIWSVGDTEAKHVEQITVPRGPGARRGRAIGSLMGEQSEKMAHFPGYGGQDGWLLGLKEISKIMKITGLEFKGI